MSQDMTVRKTFWIRNEVIAGPFFDPTIEPCRVLFLWNASNTLAPYISVESSMDGGETDYWVPVLLGDCDECEFVSAQIMPRGHKVILFRPPERYFRILLSLPVPEGVRCEMAYFSDAIEGYDRED